MSLIDFILNLAALLLWLNWRTAPYDPLHTATPATLAGTLRRAEPSRVRRWHLPAALAALLLVRAEFYHLLGPALNWTATLNVFTTRLAFRCDVREMMLLYSALSFALALGVLLLGLLLLTLVGRGHESVWPMRMARAQLGGLSEWVNWKKLLLPPLAALVIWWLLSWPFSRWGLIPPPDSEGIRLAQAGLFGLGSYLAWKYFIFVLLGLHLLHNHVYFGSQPIWGFVDLAARRLLRPLRPVPLRVGKFDLAPLLALLLVGLGTHVLEHGIRSPSRLDAQGRPERPRFEIPGLAGWYERISR